MSFFRVWGSGVWLGRAETWRRLQRSSVEGGIRREERCRELDEGGAGLQDGAPRVCSIRTEGPGRGGGESREPGTAQGDAGSNVSTHTRPAEARSQGPEGQSQSRMPCRERHTATRGNGAPKAQRTGPRAVKPRRPLPIRLDSGLCALLWHGAGHSRF